MRRLAIVALALFAAAIGETALAGVFATTKHGDPANGVQRLQDEPRGECAQCHDQHASRLGVPTAGPNPFLLFAPNDNALCLTCHNASSTAAVWQGTSAYAASSHAVAGGMIWPGPVPAARGSSDANKCVNCHDPHGASDASGLVPALTLAREEKLCNACHDGSPALVDVTAQFQKIYRHPVSTSGKHSADEGSDPARFAASPVNNRHSECADCHNAHVAKRDGVPPLPPAASNRLLGASRVLVTNGAAGTRPNYRYAGPADASFPNEFELCFKCHSSFTTQPATQSELGVAFNPANASFHPVEAAGKSPAIAAQAFVSSWTSASLTYCTDCHSSDDTAARGPHGSSYRHILKKAYADAPGIQSVSSTDLCFDCHTYGVYANDLSMPALKAASRFNPPGAAQGHTFHVGAQGIGCYSCHASHGSPNLPALLVTGRLPGITSFVATAAGGTCTTSCHAPAAYTVAYPR